MADIKFAEGLYFKEPNANAPDFVKGKLSIQKDKLMGWLEMTPANEKGYINLDIKVGKGGKPYISVDEWVPNNAHRDEPQQKEQQNTVDDTCSDDSVPF